MYIPYMDSLTRSLEIRLSPINEIPFKLGFLYPSIMLKIKKNNFIKNLQELYNCNYKI